MSDDLIRRGDALAACEAYAPTSWRPLMADAIAALPAALLVKTGVMGKINERKPVLWNIQHMPPLFSWLWAWPEEFSPACSALAEE